MKYLRYIWMALLSLTLLSCHEDEKFFAKPSEQVEEECPLILEKLSDRIVVTEDNLQSEITFLWSPVDYGIPASVTYSLYASFNDKVFQIGESHTTSYKMTKENFNNLLVDKKKLSVPEKKTEAVFFYVEASISASSPEYTYRSNVVMIEVTTIKSTAAPWIRRPLYVPGEHQGWDPSKAPVIWETGEYTDIYEGLVYLVKPQDASAATQFKVSPNPEWRGDIGGTLDNMHTDAGPDGNLTVPAGGLYWLHVELAPDQKSGVGQALPVASVEVVGDAVGGSMPLTLKGLPQTISDDTLAEFYAAVNAQCWSGVKTDAVSGKFLYVVKLESGEEIKWGADLSHLEREGVEMQNSLSGKVEFSVSFRGDVASLIEDILNPQPYFGQVTKAE